MKYKLISNNKEETIALGKFIAAYLTRGDVITLEGDLGAGKTTFVKGVGLALGITQEINSPTFNILKCYFVKPLPLYHIDAYRLEGVDDENKNVGLEEVIEGDGVCLIEWPKFIEEKLLGIEVLKIVINMLDNEKRSFVIESNNIKFKKLFDNLEGHNHE